MRSARPRGASAWPRRVRGCRPARRCWSSAATIFFFSSRRRHTRWPRDWSSDVCSSDLVTLAHNDAFGDGQEGSVRIGLEALSGSFDAVFVAPCDLPLIGAADLTELIGAFKKRADGHIIIPIVDGRRGNPILLDEFAHAQILAGAANLACRH